MKTDSALIFEKALEDSKRFNGAFGVISWALVTALRRAGATEDEVSAAFQPLKKSMGSISKNDVDVLARVVYARMKAEQEKR